MTQMAAAIAMATLGAAPDLAAAGVAATLRSNVTTARDGRVAATTTAHHPIEQFKRRSIRSARQTHQTDRDHGQ
jgi:hypothetical protein